MKFEEFKRKFKTGTKFMDLNPYTNDWNEFMVLESNKSYIETFDGELFTLKYLMKNIKMMRYVCKVITNDL